MLSHSGSTVGFRNYLLGIPERRLLVVVLMNRSDGEAEKLARELPGDVLHNRKMGRAGDGVGSK